MSALSDADVSELQQKLDAEVEANLGMAMIYNLITAAQEWVDEKVLRKAGGHGRGLASWLGSMDQCESFRPARIALWHPSRLHWLMHRIDESYLTYTQPTPSR